jgi:hypothetical protein
MCLSSAVTFALESLGSVKSRMQNLMLITSFQKIYVCICVCAYINIYIVVLLYILLICFETGSFSAALAVLEIRALCMSVCIHV